MPFHHFTEKKAIQFLGTQSRRTDITPYQLSQIHIELGKYLGYQILEEFTFEDYQIHHPQGIKLGRRLVKEDQIVILVFQRSGVYVGEGLRFVFQNSPYYLVSPIRGIGLSNEVFQKLLPVLVNRTVILVDSVINTGSTIKQIIQQIRRHTGSQKIIVTSIVMPDTTAEVMKTKFVNVCFYIARISTNKYVGKGKTDTGNRLFGTYEIG